MPAPSFTVPTSGNYEDSVTGRRFQVIEGQVIPRSFAARLGLAGAVDPGTGEVVATADGTGTGQIADGTDFVTVTSANANHIVTLPTPTPGTTVAIFVAATGYELRSSAPATVGINGGTGASAESAIPAGSLTVCVCVSATAWRCTDQAADGSVVTTEAAS